MAQDIFKITKWKTYDNYECLFCSYSTLELENAESHYQERHAPPVLPPPPSRIIRVDRFGNPVEPPISVEEEEKK